MYSLQVASFPRQGMLIYVNSRESELMYLLPSVLDYRYGNGQLLQAPTIMISLLWRDVTWCYELK